jgi:hypothetical protein
MACKCTTPYSGIFGFLSGMSGCCGCDRQPALSGVFGAPPAWPPKAVPRAPVQRQVVTRTQQPTGKPVVAIGTRAPVMPVVPVRAQPKAPQRQQVRLQPQAKAPVGAKHPTAAPRAPQPRAPGKQPVRGGSPGKLPVLAPAPRPRQPQEPKQPTQTGPAPRAPRLLPPARGFDPKPKFPAVQPRNPVPKQPAPPGYNPPPAGWNPLYDPGPTMAPQIPGYAYEPPTPQLPMSAPFDPFAPGTPILPADPFTDYAANGEESTELAVVEDDKGWIKWAAAAALAVLGAFYFGSKRSRRAA